jgi:hypothetical protein
MQASASRTFHSVRCAGSASGRLLQVRICRQQPRRRGHVLGPAAFRAPAAIIDAALDRGIEHGAIDAGLSAGEEFHGRSLMTLRRSSFSYFLRLYSKLSVQADYGDKRQS